MEYFIRMGKSSEITHNSTRKLRKNVGKILIAKLFWTIIMKVVVGK